MASVVVILTVVDAANYNASFHSVVILNTKVCSFSVFLQMTLNSFRLCVELVYYVFVPAFVLFFYITGYFWGFIFHTTLWDMFVGCVFKYCVK